MIYELNGVRCNPLDPPDSVNELLERLLAHPEGVGLAFPNKIEDTTAIVLCLGAQGMGLLDVFTYPERCSLNPPPPGVYSLVRFNPATGESEIMGAKVTPLGWAYLLYREGDARRCYAILLGIDLTGHTPVADALLEWIDGSRDESGELAVVPAGPSAQLIDAYMGGGLVNKLALA